MALNLETLVQLQYPVCASFDGGNMKICGVRYDVVETEDVFDVDATHFGQIDFKKGRILLNKDLSEDVKAETLVHEVTHALLVYIGRQDLTEDEQFVQALGNAIYQTFDLKETE